MNKRVGRVGDSPILGAGTYADDDGGRLLGDRRRRGDPARSCLAQDAPSTCCAPASHPEEAARAVIRTLARASAARAASSSSIATGRLGFARNTRTMTWAAAGEQLARDARRSLSERTLSSRSGCGGAGLAVDARPAGRSAGAARA